jgi:hypothetical protein
LQTYCNLGRVEEFEKAVMERIERGERHSNEPLTRQIKCDFRKPILEYDQGDKEDACEIHVRHPAKDSGEKLQVFILHGKDLVSWVQLTDKPGTDVFFVKRIYDGQLHFG